MMMMMMKEETRKSQVEQFCFKAAPELNDFSDGTALSQEGRAFQARAAATGNARSPSVV